RLPPPDGGRDAHLLLGLRAGDHRQDVAMELPSWAQILSVQITSFALKLLGAAVVWMLGRRLIGFAVRISAVALRRQAVDETLVGFLGSAITIVLNVVLVMAILGLFGVETTTFAALLAGAGLAIGTAWGGILANFASGVFLVALRPYRVGDF